MHKKQSIGNIIVGISTILLGAYWLFTISPEVYFNFPKWAEDFGIIMALGFFIMGSIYICYLIGGMGIIFLKTWGKNLVIISAMVGILLRLYTLGRYCYILLAQENAYLLGVNMIPDYLVLSFEILVLHYLTRPKVKEQFK